MNSFAYLATRRMIALLENLSKIKVIVHGRESIPEGSIIFVINHFTRIETFIMPLHIYNITQKQVWSLADSSFFEGPIASFLEKVGAVSTSNPDRDCLMVKSLLTGEANWIIFPEGRMVKDKGYVEKTRFFIVRAGGRPPAHTGAATLALRTEFYRQRLISLVEKFPAEAERLKRMFSIDDLSPVLLGKTWIVPVNITYYPVRAQENVLSMLADRFAKNIPERIREELLTEGTMFFSGVDIDIRFGPPLEVKESLALPSIEKDIHSLVQFNFDDHLPSLHTMREEATRLMDRYMSSIYDMTTVNHDHLFASLLRAMPFRKVNEDDFRRRVFLLAALYLPNAGVHCHQSLAIGQVALLTDDRFHKFRDFSMLALETKVIQRHDGLLIKDPSKFSSAFDLHRARIDNPLGVIANEVIALEALQKQVRRMAWLPGVLVRQRVVKLLDRLAFEEFDRDYRNFQRAGETKGREIGAPELMRGRSRGLGVVLVHGLLAAPRELAELATYLNDKGYWVYVVRLKGHGTSPDDLAIRTANDWVESVDLGYALMSSICKRVVVGGFSFGGGLALDCAARVGNVAGVFAVCPPLRLQDKSSRLAPLVSFWNKVMGWISYQGGKRDFIESTPERPLINYSRIPVAALWEMGRFMKGLEQKLAKVLAPTLVVQSQGDPVADPDGTKILYSRLGSKDKEYLSYDFDRHGILVGEGSQKVHQAIGVFIDRLQG
ncbi:MAG: alpha/beta fold hydrolase [Geobacteraceae bacterium]